MHCLCRVVLCLVAVGFAVRAFAADGDFQAVYTVNATTTASTTFISTNDVFVDGSGNVYHVGNVQNTAASSVLVDLDPGAGNSNITVGASGFSQYAVKLNSSGVLQWAVQYATSSTGAPDSVAVDASGNVYIAGTFAGTQDFNPQGGTANLTGQGGADIYLLKLNSSGTYQWAVQWGNGDQSNPGFSEIAAGIGFDTSGNPVICGRFTSAIDADPTGGTLTLNPAGSGDNFFLASLSPAGALNWAKAVGGSCFPRKMITDANGNIYVSGNFGSGSTDFDPDAGTLNIAHNGSSDSFVAKYTSSGAAVWAAGNGSSSDFEHAADIAVDLSGNVYATGRFRGDTDFDPTGGTFTITHANSGTSDIYVWKLTSSGGFGYAKAMQSTTSANEEGTAIAVDGGNNVLVGGNFQGTVDFDPGAGTQTSTGSGGNHMFLARLDSAGDYLWHGTIFGSGFSNSVQAIHLGRDGAATVAGVYQGSPDFDMRAGTQTRAASGSIDGFVLTLDGLDPLVITESDGSTSVGEGGITDSYTVLLGFQNTHDVTIDLTPSVQLDVGAGAGVVRNITFATAANDWSNPRIVNVAALDDLVVEGAHAGTIAHAVSASGDAAFTGAAGGTLNVVIADNDAAGAQVVQSGGVTQVTEGGATDTITVQLTSIPSAPVFVSIAHSATRTLLDGGTGTEVLTFAADASAADPQSVTVSAVDDLVAEGPHSDTLTFSVSSADLDYNGLSLSAVNVDITDNDTPGLALVESDGSTTAIEGGTGDSFTVALGSRPTAAVTVTLQPDAQVDAGAGAGNAVQLSFPATNAALTPQVVNVSAVDDADIEGAHQGLIAISTASADVNYTAFTPQLLVDITDNDVPTCDNPAGCAATSTTHITVSEGDDVCLRVPDPVLPNTAYVWRREGDVLVEGRFVGTACRTLSISGITVDEAGTYTCEYDTGAKAPAVHTVVVEVLPVASVPGPGLGALLVLAAAVGAIGLRRTRRL